MVKETIKIFEDGKYNTYERDLAKQPLTLEDWYNATVIDSAQHNYGKKTTSDSKLTKKDAEDLVNADIKFIVAYFRNQFNFEQAKNGISPQVMGEDFNRWYAQSAGTLAVDDGKSPKK